MKEEENSARERYKMKLGKQEVDPIGCYERD